MAVAHFSHESPCSLLVWVIAVGVIGCPSHGRKFAVEKCPKLCGRLGSQDLPLLDFGDQSLGPGDPHVLATIRIVAQYSKRRSRPPVAVNEHDGWVNRNGTVVNERRDWDDLGIDLVEQVCVVRWVA